MIVELGAPVILREDEPGVWHLPVPSTELLSHVEVTIDDAMQRLSASWPTLCLRERGEIFVYGGFVRSRVFCRGCAFLNRQQPHLVPPREAAEAAAYDQLRLEHAERAA